MVEAFPSTTTPTGQRLLFGDDKSCGRRLPSDWTPWVGLAAAVGVQIASSNTYSLPLYSNALKQYLVFLNNNLQFTTLLTILGKMLVSFWVLTLTNTHRGLFIWWLLLLLYFVIVSSGLL
ncbi:hypothetical protein L1887_07906 [Cichorium endivia]|nr:hypothetical protein L1887_07906 [Cichorium endivia]